jgi:hypothetical protein
MSLSWIFSALLLCTKGHCHSCPVASTSFNIRLGLFCCSNRNLTEKLHRSSGHLWLTMAPFSSSTSLTCTWKRYLLPRHNK